MLSLNCFSQTNWTQEELECINKYGLSQNDHRGVVFVSNPTSSLTVLEAIEGFFNASIKQDLIELQVSKVYFDEKYFNRPLDIRELIQYYIILKK